MFGEPQYKHIIRTSVDIEQFSNIEIQTKFNVFIIVILLIKFLDLLLGSIRFSRNSLVFT